MSEGFRFVFSGGPAVGKTTLVNHLRGMGYTTLPETAREVIEEQKALGSEVLPWRNRPAFQQRVLEIQRKREEQMDADLVFLDRGLPDGIAYLQLDGDEVLPDLLRYSPNRYTAVFLLEPVGKFEKDEVRFEDPKTAKTVHHLLADAYRDLGYPVIKVEATSVERRAEFVLAEVAKITGDMSGN